jgi:hypothetical protein
VEEIRTEEDQKMYTSFKQYLFKMRVFSWQPVAGLLSSGIHTAGWGVLPLRQSLCFLLSLNKMAVEAL